MWLIKKIGGIFSFFFISDKKPYNKKNAHVSAEKKDKTNCVVGATNFGHFFLLCTNFYYGLSFRGFKKNEIILFIHFFSGVLLHLKKTKNRFLLFAAYCNARDLKKWGTILPLR